MEGFPMWLLPLSGLPVMVLMFFFLRRNQQVLDAAARPPELTQFERAQRCRIADLIDRPDEVVHLVGVLRGNARVTGPLGDRAGLGVRTRVRAFYGRGGYADVVVESALADCELDDDTGIVRLRGAGAIVWVSSAHRTADPTGELSARARAAAHPSFRHLRGEEWSCQSGDRVAVTARVPRRAEGGLWRASSEIVLETTGTTPLVVSDEAGHLGGASVDTTKPR